MRSRAARLTLVFLFLIAIGAGAYVFWIDETQVRGDAAAAREFDDGTVAALVQVHELRAAQQAYVAAGQGEDFWVSKVAGGVATLRDSLTVLRAQAAAPAAQTAIDTAVQSIHGFEQMDRRAREYARSGQKLLASDLIFADGLEVTAATAAAIGDARHAERSERERAIAAGRLQQAAVVGGVLALGLLTAILLLPAGRKAEPEIAPAREAPIADPVPSSDVLELDSGWTAKAAPAPPVPPPVDLAPIASLCSDLARVVDTQALPALLERAAHVLDAAGIVVWIADPDGRELMPVLTHGYAPTVVTRLGTLLRDTENATAAAFRTGLLQTVKADAMSHGAIAAPLVTPAGCVGVMAAEVRNDGEQDDMKRAAAAIVAAQLATLVGPPSARNNHKAEAAG